MLNKYFLCLIMSLAGMSLMAEPENAKVTFLDGYEVTGYADITKNDKIEFRLELNETPDTFDEFDVKRLDFLEEPRVSFEYVDIRNSGYKLLKVVSEGPVIAYVQTTASFSTQKTARQLAKEDYLNGEFTRSGSYRVKGKDGKTYVFTGNLTGQNKPVYFIMRNGDKQAKNIKMGFKKKAVTFFKDCPYLVDIIKNKEWKYRDMPNIVEYYNEMCSE